MKKSQKIRLSEPYPFPHSLDKMKKANTKGFRLGIVINIVLLGVAYLLNHPLALETLISFGFLWRLVVFGFLFFIIIPAAYAGNWATKEENKIYKEILEQDQENFIKYILPVLHEASEKIPESEPLKRGEVTRNSIDEALDAFKSRSRTFYSSTIEHNRECLKEMEKILKEHPLKPANYSTIARLLWPSVKPEVEKMSQKNSTKSWVVTALINLILAGWLLF